MVSITQSDRSVKKVSKAEIAEQLGRRKTVRRSESARTRNLQNRTDPEREAALEELGINLEKGFVGVSTPKKIRIWST